MALFSRPSSERVRAVVRLARVAPDLRFTSLVPGVDNFRHDVYLSPKLLSYTANFLYKLFLKHSSAGELVEHNPGPPKPQERNEFKRLLQEVLLAALSRAKTARNPEIDLLANAAVFKYLNWELQQQYARILQEARNKLKMFEGPRHERNVRAFKLKELFSEYQTNKKNILRRVSSELLQLVNEVQADAVRRTRESFFGAEAGPWFAYFSNPLVFTDNGRDDYIHLAKYALFGNFNKDPDLYENVEEWLKTMLAWLDAAGPEARELENCRQEHQKLAAETEALRQQVNPAEKSRGFSRLFGSRPEPAAAAPSQDLVNRLRMQEVKLAQSAEHLKVLTESYNSLLGEMLNAPDNVEETLGLARTERQIVELREKQAATAALEEKLEIQRFLVEEFYNSAQQRGLLPCFAAAYETAAIHQDYCPPINPQQLKHALLDPAERRKTADMIVHYKLAHVGMGPLEEAVARIRGAQPRELRVIMLRFLADFTRHRRDSRLLAVLQALMDKVNLASEEKTRQLSRINNTLFEFLLPEEQKPQDDLVVGHVILKADVRDSTALTADLLARGLNPASHFSLNFYEPLNKLLPRYAAEKVFIEGDAVILAMFEKEGPLGGYPVARACGLAREMMEVVNLYNSRADKAGLPRLEIGIGICWQNSAPLYLLDGETRIMISSAINLADRLSGCSKLARRVLSHNDSLFNVFVFQTIPEDAAAGAMEEFLVRYNTGVSLSEEAFEKLQEEISLQMLEIEMPLLWEAEKVRLHCGSFPLSPDVFQRLVIREAQIAFVDAHSFHCKEYTSRRYYEVCTNRLVYDYTEQNAPRTAQA